jgi:hypothetical protein
MPNRSTRADSTPALATYVITNASGSSNMERCLIFGGGRFSLRGFNNTVPLTFR